MISVKKFWKAWFTKFSMWILTIKRKDIDTIFDISQGKLA